MSATPLALIPAKSPIPAESSQVRRAAGTTAGTRQTLGLRVPLTDLYRLVFTHIHTPKVCVEYADTFTWI
jgi:hypothetical protein